VVLLPIALLAVAVTAMDAGEGVISSARNVMLFEASPIVLAANNAARIVCTQPLKRILAAAFLRNFRPFPSLDFVCSIRSAFAFHGHVSFSNDDFVNLFKGLIAG
jgi:hypothetical protein